MEAYLDHAASTPARPEVVEAMLPWLAEHPGNPSGAHRLAREARRALDDARDAVAALVGADPGDVVFTSGGTEADNLAVDGVLGARGGVAVCGATEHPAVLDPVRLSGGVVVPTDAGGRIDADALAATLDAVADVRLVSVIAANNETGVVNDVPAVAALVAEHAPDAAVHTDAVQATAWLDLAAATGGAHLVSLTGHKFGGPKGAGALVLRDGATVAPVLRGGGQERERRSGTQNVPAIVGLGVAARLVATDRDDAAARVGALRDRLEAGLLAAVPDARRTVPDGVARTAGVAHVCVPGIESEALLFLLERDGISASAASSCASGAQEPSHVLAAMGVDRDAAVGSLRLSLGHGTTDAEVDHALAAIPAAVARLREHAR
ncbi:MAG: cysteine desulfurase [Acidimicrobiaceae bacterium]|nr:cysteine desulfurase [Acidimicrobiaceae bacterium]